MKKFFTFLLVISLASCGFEPLYANKNKSKNGSGKCSNFKVGDPKISLPGKRMQYLIQDKLNQACMNSDKNYLVDINSTLSEEAISIQIDRQVTRFNVILDSDYTLRDLDENKTLLTGKTKSVGGYDAVLSEYGRYALRQDAKNKLAEEMAQDISFKILYYLKNKNKKS